MAITLSEQSKERLLTSIKRYFLENLEDEIGDLKATLFLDFCLQEIGASVYNQAILDAQTYIQEKAQDLEGSCYEPEFGYWQD